MIEFTNVSKSFNRRAERMLLRGYLKELFRSVKQPRFYALKNVSFRLREGESVAVIGPNGAGKSTLLSLVTGLCLPDEGRVAVNGRVAALLELGSGFAMDLTGAENVYLNAALLGFNRKKTDQVFDRIVEFAGIGDFICEPLRTYSSGMIMRLAFSVAVNVDPEILVIDEVLAVGDQAFQAKCLEKILEFKNSGKTILCVSHNVAMIQELCARALWLDHGQLVLDGSIAGVLQAYTAGVAGLASSAVTMPGAPA